jgi:hypothetical protein
MSYTTGFKGRYGFHGANPSGFHSRETPFVKNTGGIAEKATFAKTAKVEKKAVDQAGKNVQELKVKEVQTIQPTVGDQVQDREMNASIRE